MSWGTGPWGTGAWGTGVVLPPPSVFGLSPGIIARRGGSIVKIVGEHFADPMIVELIQSAQVVGAGYYFDAEFDLERNRLFVGTPALPDGFYSLRVTTAGGESNILEDALEVRLFSEEVRVHRVRIGFAAPWLTGPRMLTNQNTGI